MTNPELANRSAFYETYCGQITICGLCEPGFFRNLKLDDGLGHFSHYSSIIQKLDAFETIATRKGGRVTLAIVGNNVVAGYCVGAYPDKRRQVGGSWGAYV